MQQLTCTPQLLLLEIILSACQETILFMQERVLQANLIQCKFILNLIAIFYKYIRWTTL